MMLFLVSRNSWSKSEGLKHTICFTRIRTVILVLRLSAENVLGRWETLRKAKRKGGRKRKKVHNVSEYRLSCSPLNSQEIEEQNSVEKKELYSEKLVIWGDGGLMSGNHLPRFSSATRAFKGKRGGTISVNHWGRKSDYSSFSLACRPADFSPSSLGCCLARRVGLGICKGEEAKGRDLASLTT